MTLRTDCCRSDQSNLSGPKDYIVFGTEYVAYGVYIYIYIYVRWIVGGVSYVYIYICICSIWYKIYGIRYMVQVQHAILTSGSYKPCFLESPLAPPRAGLWSQKMGAVCSYHLMP